MGKYIDLEPLINALKAIQKRSELISVDEVLGVLAKYPAADVVEVVRCEDCKYLDYVDEHEKWCMGRGYPATMVKDDGYCEIGKRKEES